MAQDPAVRYPYVNAFVSDLATLVTRAADPLAQPYQALQDALHTEDWEQANQLAQDIVSRQPDYRDIKILAKMVAEMYAQAERKRWAEQWRAQALAAEQIKQWPVARLAAQRWLDMAPGDGEARALLERLAAQEAQEQEAQRNREEAAQQALDLAAQVAAQPGQLQNARAAAQRWVDIAPDDKAARDLLAELIVQEEAERKAKAEADRKAKAEADRRAKEDADRKAKEEVERKAQAAAAAKASQTQIAGLYTHIQTAADQQDWPEVLQLAGQIQALQPGDATAAQWNARAREQLRRPAVTSQPSPVAAPTASVARLPFEPELILIPAGEFLMGSDPQKDKDAQADEQPQHTLYLPDYYIAKTPTTNAQYAAFVQATGYKAPSHWKNGKLPQGKEDHPVVNVSWEDAMAYCKWLVEVTGKLYTLPSEAEWEKAARGTDGRLYPWGDTTPNERLCNFNQNVKDTTPVGKYSPGGDSPYGCVDMAGNVWDWTRSLKDFTYLYRADDGREDVQATGSKVLRGGSWRYDDRYVTTTGRSGCAPTLTSLNVGFRCSVARAQD